MSAERLFTRVAPFLLGGVIAVAGCEGPAGVAGTNGTPGAKGDPGSPGTKGDPGAPGTKGDPGAKGDPGSGTTPGEVSGLITDAAIATAAIPGVAIELQPGGLTATTDAGGRYLIQNVPPGVYRLTARGAALELQGNDVVASGTVETRAEGLSVVAGGKLVVNLSLARLPDSINTYAMMDAKKSALYKDSNCIACHSDRKKELASDGKTAAFHGMATHASTSCTTCHASIEIERGGWDTGSSVALRKNVNVALCKGCHPSYPSKY